MLVALVDMMDAVIKSIDLLCMISVEICLSYFFPCVLYSHHRCLDS